MDADQQSAGTGADTGGGGDRHRARPGRLPGAGPSSRSGPSNPGCAPAARRAPRPAAQVYFYRDGKVIHQISGIRGEVLPAFSVAGGASLEVNFGNKDYAKGIPAGFQGIIKATSLM